MRAEFIISASSPEQFPGVGLPEIAFLGRSNVGKSSLLNRLVGEKGLAFVSATPGRTQSINFFRIDGEFVFADLPGYGYAKVPREFKDRWKQLVESYLLRSANLALCLLLVDSRRGWMDKDLELRQWLEFQGRPFAVVATKIDKLKTQSERHHGLAALRSAHPHGELVPFSAVTGQGVREIWQAISKTKIRP